VHIDANVDNPATLGDALVCHGAFLIKVLLVRGLERIFSFFPSLSAIPRELIQHSDFQLLGDGKAVLECILAFVMSLGFQLKHKATGSGGGCRTRHAHDARVRLGEVTIWRIQCTTCKAVFTVLPHFGIRDRSMRPEGARDALLATHGGLSVELCAVL
jgi:hypothetical protein